MNDQQGQIKKSNGLREVLANTYDAYIQDKSISFDTLLPSVFDYALRFLSKYEHKGYERFEMGEHGETLDTTTDSKGVTAQSFAAFNEGQRRRGTISVAWEVNPYDYLDKMYPVVCTAEGPHSLRDHRVLKALLDGDSFEEIQERERMTEKAIRSAMKRLSEKAASMKDIPVAKKGLHPESVVKLQVLKALGALAYTNVKSQRNLIADCMMGTRSRVEMMKCRNASLPPVESFVAAHRKEDQQLKQQNAVTASASLYARLPKQGDIYRRPFYLIEAENARRVGGMLARQHTVETAEYGMAA